MYSANSLNAHKAILNHRVQYPTMQKAIWRIEPEKNFLSFGQMKKIELLLNSNEKLANIIDYNNHYFAIQNEK